MQRVTPMLTWTGKPDGWRQLTLSVSAFALLLALVVFTNSSGEKSLSKDRQEYELYQSNAQAGLKAGLQRHGQTVSIKLASSTSQLDMTDEGDAGVASASVVKKTVGDKSTEGQDLLSDEPDDMAAVKAAQAAVKAEADAEVDDAVAKSKKDAVTDYVASRSDFMTKEAAEPNGGVGGIIAMEGEPGHPANYARRTDHGLIAKQRRAYGSPSSEMEKTKLVERPLGAYQVQVPAGLTPGQQFLAEVPRRHLVPGQGHRGKMRVMRVTVPDGVAGGQMVLIKLASSTSQLDMTDEGDAGVASASVVKKTVGDKSTEGQDLLSDEPDDMAAVKAAQAAVKAEADAEVDDAVAKSKKDAVTDYVASRSDFMTKEAAEPNGGVGGIIAMEGEPGHPANYARRTDHGLIAKQRRAYGSPSSEMEKTKLVERPLGAYQVQVPAGLTPGQQFLAEVPRHGQMRVTVPAGAAGGQFVEIEVPAGEASEVRAEPASESDLAPIAHVVKDESKVPQLGETLTPIESGLLTEAEHSIASNISTVLGELRTKLHVMAMSYKDQENLAAKDKNTFAAKEDAEYQTAIKNLLGKVVDDQNVYDSTKVRVVKDITKSLPSFVGIGHQVKDFSGVTKRVPMTGGWKTDVEKGLDAWRNTKTEHRKVLPDVPRSDEEWKNMKDDVKKNLGDAITKAADDYVKGKEITEQRSEEVRKGLGDANENVKSWRITPDSLTDAILTDCGAIKGAKIGSVRVFKGIPYAKAPTGALRWMPPVPRHAKNENGNLDGCWVGTLMATDFGSVCPQAWDAVLSKDEKQSEDCLSLNIYAPTVESEEAVAGVRDKLPVVVFVHGGGNVAGAGSRYDMWDVADRGFVAVTINYRLGALGFLALSSLSQESASGTSGNYGIRDIALSLEWVQRNIANFGGDPQHVTLMGHGSGATNVLGLSISPMAMLRLEGADEIELLKNLRRLLGVLDDQPLDDVSKQAGGYMVSMAHAATVKQLKANIAELKISAAKRGVISLKQLDVLQSKLSSFTETDAVKKLVNGMLKEHAMRSEVKSSAGSSTKLFHGMVLLSAAPRIDRTRQDAESDNEQIAISAHCKQGTTDSAFLADEAKCLRNLDVESLLDATPLIKWDPHENPNANQYDLPVKGYRHLGLLVVDGQVIPEPLLTAFEKKRFIDVPVMATIMGEEPDSQPPKELLSWKQLRDVVSNRLYSFGTFWDGKPDSAPDSWSGEALKLYSSDIYSNPQEAYESMITDVRLTCATKEAMRIVASASTQPVYMGINRLRLREPVAVVALASNGIRSQSTRGLAAALVMDYASKYSFHGLDLVLYMQDETRYKLTNHDKFTAASFQGLIDTFVRAGSMNAPATSEFAAREMQAYHMKLALSWKDVADAPNFITVDSLAYPSNLYVAEIEGANGESKVTMTDDYHSDQCTLWMKEGMGRSYASAA